MDELQNEAVRAFCFDCLKSQASCLCNETKPFVAGPLFVILMHPKERRKRSGTGTGRITHLCIENSLLFEGVDFQDDTRIGAILNDSSLCPMVLYPADGAFNISNEAVAQNVMQIIGNRRPAIFVIDGSWACAKKIMRLNPWLKNLPALCFQPSTPSQYTFKTQPHEQCLSTLEAVHSLIDLFNRFELCVTKPKHVHDNLMDVFRMLVDYQLKFSFPGKPRRVTL